MDSRLTSLQREILEGVFRYTRDFVLTGGGALAGFHLGHRVTHDLDLFTSQADALANGDRVLSRVATDLGASLESVQTAPDFHRRILRRGAEFVVVDLVRDPLSGLFPKESRGEIILDSPLEILANKLCAVLGRSELRDLVDLRALEQSGMQMEDALPIAFRKDGGATPGQLAWVLSTIQIGPDARIPGGGSGAELQSYVRKLIDRLAALSVPGPKA